MTLLSKMRCTDTLTYFTLFMSCNYVDDTLVPLYDDNKLRYTSHFPIHDQ